MFCATAYGVLTAFDETPTPGRSASLLNRIDFVNSPLTSTINSAEVQSAIGIRQFVPLTWLALGTFATGTESFMIAALLPGLARDLSVTLTAAGQLVTIFALTYGMRP